MKVHVRKEFRPYTISIETSKDHLDLLRMLYDAMLKQGPHTVGGVELAELRNTLIKTQSGGEQ